MNHQVYRVPFAIALFAMALFRVPSLHGESPDFEKQIAPLLIKRCVECHQGSAPSGGLNLTSEKGLRAGGDSGDTVDAEHPTDSYLWQRVTDGDMPPEQRGQSQKLPANELALLRAWLEAGAEWPEGRELDYFERTNDIRAGRDWWSLQPIRRPTPPKLHDAQASGSAHPIDAFVHAQLEDAGISPAPKADKRTLLTRLYYDLVGLPPTEEEILAFEQDEAPQAWERRVNRLLDTPQYGERWGRYWLDLVRYADTSGYERDQEKPFAWKYRDWVVRSLNEDMPYDQFVIQQLAGDELLDSTKEQLIATGFLRLGTWNDEPNDPEDYQYDRLEDLVHTTSTAFLGLTVKCARCHSHKFDPITQEDYYRMGAAFWPGPVRAGGAREQLGGPTNEHLGFEDVLGWTDLSASPPPLRVLKNGERHQPLEEATAGSLSAIPALASDFAPPGDDAKTTGRRLQLARWITDPANPLTARVLVNRLWLHHFGKAIVRTPNNFGFLADPPTHPLLLDYLAAKFIDGGFRIKPMHRLILTSETWKQSSLHPEVERLEKLDSTNRLWWRAERRRLDAESLRDTLLSVTGELDLKVGGPGFKPAITPEALEGLSRKTQAWQASSSQEQRRRSLYIYMKRGLLPPIMTTFDLCDPTASCGKRDVTIVPTQALALLNNQFIHDRSERLAQSIADKHDAMETRVRQAWIRALRRAPTESELTRSIVHVERQMQAFQEMGNRQLETKDNPKQLPENAAKHLAFHFRADQAVLAGKDGAPNSEESSDSRGRRVARVKDLSGHGHHAQQSLSNAQPQAITSGIGGQPSLQFDGRGQFMKIQGPLLDRSECTIFCVVSDDGKSGHREIISNWNGEAGNSTSSMFLGLTGKSTIRFTDVHQDAGKLLDPSDGLLLSAVSGATRTLTFQDGRLLATKPAIGERRLDTSWVIGQQGNIQGEYWNGQIAEIRVYDRALSDEERHSIERILAARYKLPWEPQASTETPQPKPALSPDVLGLASLCHALLNSNEFLFID